MPSKKIIIIGAGITGLSLGWFLKQKQADLDLLILEKDVRPGGWIRSCRQEGFLFEQGPRSCRTKGNGIETLQLVEQLGLENQVITASPFAKNRYLYFDQKMHLVPGSLFALFTSPLIKNALALLWKEWRTPKESKDDETIYEFISRRFNSHVAEKFIDPFVSGIYAGDIRRLSIRSCFPLLHQWEKEHGSLLRGMLKGKTKKKERLSPFVQKMRKHSIFSFQEGMETLPRILAERLHHHLRFDCSVKSLEVFSDRVHLETKQGEAFEADHVVFAASSDMVSNLLLPSSGMQEWNRASVAVVNLAWNSKINPYEGFGYLIPSSENEQTLGIVWDSSVFPEQNKVAHETRFTVMIGGDRMRDFHKYDEQDFLKIAEAAVERHLRIKKDYDAANVTLAHKAIPQYYLGHWKKILSLESKLFTLSPRLHIAGQDYNGIGINECIANSRKLANLLS